MPDTHLIDEALEEVFDDSIFETPEAPLIGPDQADTVVMPFNPLLDTLALEQMEPVMVAYDTIEAVAEPPKWQEGLEPMARPDHPGHRTEILAVIALMTVLITYNFRHLKRLVGVFWEEAVKIKRARGNVFDERPASDVPVQGLLVVQCVVCCGILLALGIHLAGSDGDGMSLITRSTLAVATYYALAYCAYEAVGYTFTTPHGRREWVRGFSAGQALLGIALTIPTAVAVFYPAVMFWVVLFGAVTWIMAKILFIIKGFRIFYDTFSGLLYFILYLCTLEIIPLIWVYRISVY